MISRRKNIAYIGLGKMGLNMVTRLLKKKYRVSVYDSNAKAMGKIKKSGGVPVDSLKELARTAKSPRLFWLMVPHEAVSSVLKNLEPYLKKGDVLIDGGNSPYWKSEERAKALKKKGIHFLDVGVSGGPSGAKNGASLMIGGNRKIYKKHEGLFRDLSVKNGFGYFGQAGAGHFVKMIHNGIEYGMMQAIAEGFAILKKSRFKIDLKNLIQVYNHGSVVESRLTKWLAQAFKKEGTDLKKISGRVSQSGESLWAVKVARQMKIPVPVIEAALKFRLTSQKKPSYTGQVLSAMRNQFGGHSVTKK